MKELVFVLPDKNGGVASVIYNILKFNNSSYTTKVILLQACENDKNNNTIQYKFPCNSQIVIRYKQSSPKYKVYNLIIKHLNENSILISNDGNIELGAIFYHKINIPIVYILHGNMDYYFNIIKRYQCLIDLVICVSSYLNDRVQGTVINIKSIFIPYPVPSVPQFYKSYTNHKLRILYVGTLGDHKGVKLFPEYIRKVESSNIDYSFDIIGNGPNEPFLRNAFSNNSKVTIHGLLTQNDIFNILCQAHIILLFSINEGLPVCIVEAMKHGTVPIVFDIKSGIPDIIINNKNGFIVPQGGINEAVNATKKLFYNRHILNEMALYAQKTASSMFDPNIQANKYIEAITSVTYKIKQYKITFLDLFSTYIPSRIIYFLYKHKKTILTWRRHH